MNHIFAPILTTLEGGRGRGKSTGLVTKSDIKNRRLSRELGLTEKGEGVQLQRLSMCAN